MRAFSPDEILNKKYKVLQWGQPWEDAFGQPETTGLWSIDGNSGNGKTGFVLQLMCELSYLGKVFLNSLEEGNRKTMQEKLQLIKGLYEKKNVLIGCESMTDLNKRLKKRRSPQFIIIDSTQRAHTTFKKIEQMMNSNQPKLYIFISQSINKKLIGQTAVDVKFAADLKIHVEGHKAISNGRYNPGGEYVIWENGVQNYWGKNTIAI